MSISFVIDSGPVYFSIFILFHWKQVARYAAFAESVIADSMR